MMQQVRTALALPLAVRLTRKLYHPPSDWAERRDAQIRSLVQHAHDTTPFYRRRWQAAGVDPRQVRGAADLERLPIVERAEWRNAPPNEIHSTDRRLPWRWIHTGGTTGDPLDLPRALLDDSAETAGMIAVYLANGMRWRDLLARRRPSPPPVRKMPRRVGRLLYLSIRMDPDEQQTILAAGGYPFVRGCPMPIWRSVVRSRRAGHALPPIQTLYVAGEVLTDSVRRTLAEGLGCTVVSHFGSTEVGHVAAQCPAGRLHIFAPTVHLEILVDGRPAFPGEPGEVVATSFLTRARPVVRLRTSDCAAWGDGPCPCGSPVPHLAYVAGRLIDRVCLPGGRVVLGPEIEAALAPKHGQLLGFQIEQTAPEEVIARLSLAPVEMDAGPMKHALEKLFAGARIKLELTDDFRIEGGGKTRTVIGLEK